MEGSALHLENRTQVIVWYRYSVFSFNCRFLSSLFVLFPTLRENYKHATTTSVSKRSVFAHYLEACKRQSVATPISHTYFGKLVRKAFPDVRCNRKGPRGSAQQHYRLIRADGGDADEFLSAHFGDELEAEEAAEEEYRAKRAKRSSSKKKTTRPRSARTASRRRPPAASATCASSSSSSSLAQAQFAIPQPPQQHQQHQQSMGYFEPSAFYDFVSPDLEMPLSAINQVNLAEDFGWSVPSMPSAVVVDNCASAYHHQQQAHYYQQQQQQPVHSYLLADQLPATQCSDLAEWVAHYCN
ncbi:RFX DNA-binding domain containing protein [Acanthamoeba castellanii str. Neff]|uniref:RFX DNA-binding domain containing protein n=1 Tax=Acanthamoeba castellanii (strain ATCC 30010 / Neff) TaxID=1257118 RepID=L8HDZ4_ACACF|nr:RFX DNA-binding domain containing protein [Acanthamoeba castellanii str. Neff]ELR23754.1 RFX DNA-binding domain containing protein [Acanthamoeba castellanii str. Neff]